LETKRFIGADLGRLYERVRRDFGPEAIIVRTRTLVREGAEPLIEILAAPAEADGMLDLDLQRALVDGAMGRIERADRSITVGDLEDLAGREAVADRFDSRHPAPEMSDLPEWFHRAMNEPVASEHETRVHERRLAPLPMEPDDAPPSWRPAERPSIDGTREAQSGRQRKQQAPAALEDEVAETASRRILELLEQMEPAIDVVESLVEHGLTREAAEWVWEAAPGEDGERALAAALEARTATYPEEGQTALISVQGPAGAGRTTALVRMALDCADAGRPSVLLAADTERVAAREQIHAYADAIGLDVADAMQVRDIARSLVRAKAGTCLFADVAAGPWQTSPSLHGVAHFSYVAIPAHWQREALERAFAGYRLDAFAGAILTCTDLAGNLGPALSFVIEHGLGIAFLSEGRDVSTGIGVAEPLTLASGFFTMRTGERTDGSLVATA
jgi:flagellar biosynthesis GTPase FlhF